MNCSRALESQEGPQRTSETLPARVDSVAPAEAAGNEKQVTPAGKWVDATMQADGLDPTSTPQAGDRSPAPRATSEDGVAQTSETIWARDNEIMGPVGETGKREDRSRAQESRSSQQTSETLPAREDTSLMPVRNPTQRLYDTGPKTLQI